MKRLLLLLLIALFGIGTVFSQVVDIAGVQDQYEQFAEDLAPALPSAAVLGSTWSDAYIGQFPRFGAGAYVGGALLPIDSFSALLASVDGGASLPAELTELGGVPLPALGVDARLGGLILPFDVGVKIGMLPDSFQLNDKTTANYLAFGIDLRYPIVKGNIILPKISIGAGYNYLSTDIAMTGLLGGDKTIVDNVAAGADVVVSDPDFGMSWDSSVIDLRLQASKKILFLTPYIGLGASWSSSNVGGGLSSQVKNDLGAPLTQAEIDTALSTAGITGVTINTGGFVSENQVSAFTYRLYAGTSLSLLILKVDLGASYNLVTQNLAGQVGVRIQF